MSDMRVPPAVTFAFERYVAEICNQAKFDTDEWPLRARELLSHLQERWREGIAKDLSTEAAQARALELFGHPKAVARRLREPWWQRLLLHRRCQLHRHLIFLTSSLCEMMLYSFATLITSERDNIGFFSLAGCFTNSFIALGSLLLIKWQPVACAPWIRKVLLIRHVCWIFVGTGLGNVAAGSFIAIDVLLRSSWWIIVAAPVLVFTIPFGFLGAACFVSEILNLAGRRKAKSNELIAFQVMR